MIKHQIAYGLVLSFLLVMSACDSNRVFEKNDDIPQQEWLSSDSLYFDIHIADKAPKNVYLNFRHRFGFNWRNVWINMKMQLPNDSVFVTPVNIPLSQPDGQWYGDCSGDICLMKYPLPDFSSYSFTDTGTYHFTLYHDMREDPLLEVLSVGMRVEQAIAETE